jgi:hypothetical protein
MKKRSQTLPQALTEAVAKAVEEHGRRGIPLAVWRNGRAVSVSASEAGVLREKPVHYGRKAKG